MWLILPLLGLGTGCFLAVKDWFDDQPQDNP